MYGFDSGTVHPVPERGQIHVDGRIIRRPDRESVPALRKLCKSESGQRYSFPEGTVTERIERLDEAGHNITLTWKTVEKYGDNWDITEDGTHYPENWDEIRSEVYERHGYECNRCGETETELHAHHKRSISDGGNHKVRNLEAVCKDCHEDIHGFTIE